MKMRIFKSAISKSAAVAILAQGMFAFAEGPVRVKEGVGPGQAMEGGQHSSRGAAPDSLRVFNQNTDGKLPLRVKEGAAPGQAQEGAQNNSKSKWND